MALIEIRDMYKIYNPGENEVRAIDGISLEIEKGEFVAIVGHSGSGKMRARPAKLGAKASKYLPYHLDKRR